jgi:hypothetical protein
MVENRPTRLQRSEAVERFERLELVHIYVFTFVKSPAKYRFIKSFSLSGE